MALDTYANLQKSVLEWMGRPADPLVAPAVPDMIRLFEVDIGQRLRHLGNETMATLYTQTGNPDLALPDDFVELRSAGVAGLGQPLEAIAPNQAIPMSEGTGVPKWFTVFGGGDFACADGGAILRLSPPPAGTYTVNLTYLRGLPPLSDAAPTNWLLKQAPHAYLWGALVEALAYIGHDERAQVWLARRDLALEGIERADRKARWGGPLTIRPNMVTP